MPYLRYCYVWLWSLYLCVMNRAGRGAAWYQLRTGRFMYDPRRYQAAGRWRLSRR